MKEILNLALKPCRSPYCECIAGQCSHPGCYDARHEPVAWMQGTDIDDLVAEFESTPEGADAMKQGRRWLEVDQRVQEPDAYGYAKRLAVAIWEQHYKDVAPQWKPLDDLIGVLTQIDNMTAGLITPPAAQSKREAAMQRLLKSMEARLSEHQVRADKYREAIGSLASERQANARLTAELDALTAQRTPLTDEQMYEAVRPLCRTDSVARALVEVSKDEYQAIEAAHGIKERA